MSEQVKSDKRFIGKIKNVETKYGTMQKIHMESVSNQNPDGTPNQYYKGTLLWYDQQTGKTYQVKQMGFFVPRDGMSESQLQHGYTQHVTLNLQDKYEVDELE